MTAHGLMYKFVCMVDKKEEIRIGKGQILWNINRNVIIWCVSFVVMIISIKFLLVRKMGKYGFWIIRYGMKGINKLSFRLRGYKPLLVNVVSTKIK